MSKLAVIRTNRWTEDCDRLHAALHPVFGDDIVTVFHNPPEDAQAPCEIVPIGDDWVTGAGLFPIHDWGWRCGDYALYRAREAKPGYDFYWMIEPDVAFSADPAGFFALFEDRGEDALGAWYGPPKKADFRYARGIKGHDPMQAIFPLTRFSGRALDWLFKQRVEYGRSNVKPRIFANDELFCFSYVNGNPKLTAGSLTEIAPQHFRPDGFRTNPDILRDVAESSGYYAGQVLHPVRGREAFKTELTKMLVHSFRFLDHMAPSVAQLSPEELEQIIDGATRGMRARIDQSTRPHRRGKGA